ncbi:RagB/SusD family nutrient uptake outer membrane protein [Flaviramulus aquimarinus]|uniref:RagB/SusD family nutrient uptake outer membrane protein n=1 Tax=Flaviramulus aquimarinus TaxID=1170456 RepID=A0ABP9EVX8_9FLAO
MKKEQLYIIIFTSICLFSCSDFLVQEPDVQISINEQLSTKEGVFQALNGVYRDIEALLSSREIVYADVQGGNITFTPGSNDNLIDIPDVIENSYEFSDQEAESDYAGYYQDLYDIINQANIILERFEDYTFLNSDEKNQLQAELLTIRAFAHYQVAIHYAQQYGFTTDGAHLGVVYNTVPLIAGVDFPSRTNLNETYNLIKTDLDAALSLYTNSQVLSGPNYSYFNSITTQALYARIALQMNDWEQAFDFSNAVIMTSGISLTSKDNYILEWEFDEEPINEIILEFSAPRTSEGDVSSSISSHFIYNSSDNYADYVASNDLLNLYSDDDIRSNMFLEINLPTIINGFESDLPYYFTKKFQGDAGTTLIRLSEIYLIRSEANFMLTRPADALTDLNTIRERSNLLPLDNTSDILENIFLERRRELAFEGHLLFDIARYKKDVTRNLDCIANTCNLSYPSNFFVLPIPASSTDLNEKIEQNEGY